MLVFVQELDLTSVRSLVVGEALRALTGQCGVQFSFDPASKADWALLVTDRTDASLVAASVALNARVGAKVVVAATGLLSDVVSAKLGSVCSKVVQGRGDNSLKWAVRYMGAREMGEPLEVAYGAGRFQSGDLRIPPGISEGALAPLVVMFHGGFWDISHERDMLEELAADLCMRGIATYNIDYSPSQTSAWPGCLDDALAAINTIAGLAGTFRLDEGRISLLGHSAGGHLALAAAQRWSSPRTNLHSVWAMAAITDLDLAERDGLGQGSVRRLRGLRLSADWSTLSPFARSGGVPVRLVHGDADQTVPPDYTARHAAALRAQGANPKVFSLNGASHMDLTKVHSPHWQCIASAITDDMK